MMATSTYDIPPIGAVIGSTTVCSSRTGGGNYSYQYSVTGDFDDYDWSFPAGTVVENGNEEHWCLNLIDAGGVHCRRRVADCYQNNGAACFDGEPHDFQYWNQAYVSTLAYFL